MVSTPWRYATHLRWGICGHSAQWNKRHTIITLRPFACAGADQGETGTGKSWRRRPFTVSFSPSGQSPREALAAVCWRSIRAPLNHCWKLNCFGYEDGALPAPVGEDVSLLKSPSGTLFLDEIGEMPPLQTRLLRVLEEKEVTRVGGHQPIPVDVRVISATHCNSGAEMKQESFVPICLSPEHLRL